MSSVELHEDLRRELEEVSTDVIQSLAKRVLLLQEKGRSLSPPYAKRSDSTERNTAFGEPSV